MGKVIVEPLASVLGDVAMAADVVSSLSCSSLSIQPESPRGSFSPSANLRCKKEKKTIEGALGV